MWTRNRKVRAGGGLRAKVRAGAKGTEGAHAINGSGATVVAHSVIGVLGCAKAGVGATGRRALGQADREHQQQLTEQTENIAEAIHAEHEHGNAPLRAQLAEALAKKKLVEETMKMKAHSAELQKFIHNSVALSLETMQMQHQKQMAEMQNQVTQMSKMMADLQRRVEAK